MTPRSGSLLRRFAFIAAHVALAALLYAAIVWPVQSLIGEELASVADQQLTLERYTQVVRQEEAVQRYAADVRARNAQGELLAGASEGAASAALQAQLKSIATEAGANVRSIRALPPRGTAPTALIGARLELSGTLESIHTALHAIEAGAVTLVVASAVIRPAHGGRRAPNETPQLDAQFDVFGGALVRERP